MIRAEDSAGNLSEAQLLYINVKNDEADDEDEDDSGSFGWLSLLALPFVAVRRRFKA